MTHSSNDHSNHEPDDKLEILIDQVGRLTEGITDFRMAMEQTSTEFRADLAQSGSESQVEFAKIRASIREQNEISKRQAETVDRLVRVVETLIQRQDHEMSK